MIERVVLNLISNSVKYKQSGKGSIQVTVQDKEDRVIVSVKDNGIGIPKIYKRMCLIDLYNQIEKNMI